MPGDSSPLREDLAALAVTLRAVRQETWILAALSLALLAGWSLLATRLPAAVLPSPGEVAWALLQMLTETRRDFPRALAQTVLIFATGLAAAALVGGVLTWLMGAWQLLGRVLAPVFDLLGSVPNIAMMPLFVAFLGLGPEAKLAVVFLAALIPVIIAGYAALKQIDPLLAEAAASLGASRLLAWRRVVWPLALPGLVAGIRIGAIQGLSACVIAEIYTAMTGLGGLLVGYGSAFNMPRYFVVMLTLALIGIAMTALLRRLEARLRRRLAPGKDI